MLLAYQPARVAGSALGGRASRRRARPRELLVERRRDRARLRGQRAGSRPGRRGPQHPACPPAYASSPSRASRTSAQPAAVDSGPRAGAPRRRRCVILFTSGTSGPARVAVLGAPQPGRAGHHPLHVSHRLPQQLTEESHREPRPAIRDRCLPSPDCSSCSSAGSPAGRWYSSTAGSSRTRCSTSSSARVITRWGCRAHDGHAGHRRAAGEARDILSATLRGPDGRWLAGVGGRWSSRSARSSLAL